MQIFGQQIRGKPKKFGGPAKDYRVEFSYDDEATERGVARFEIKGGSRSVGTGPWRDVILHGEVDLANELIRVTYEARETHEVPMDIGLEGPVGQAGDVIDNDDALEYALGTHIEQIIQQIPAIDPFLGCLL